MRLDVTRTSNSLSMVPVRGSLCGTVGFCRCAEQRAKAALDGMRSNRPAAVRRSALSRKPAQQNSPNWIGPHYPSGVLPSDAPPPPRSALLCAAPAQRRAAQDKMTSRTYTDASASRWHACPRVVMPHGCTRAHSLKAALADLPPFSATHWQLKVAYKIIHLLRGPFSSNPTPRAAALVRDHLLRDHRSRGGVCRGEDAGTPTALVSTVCEQSEYRSSTDCGATTEGLLFAEACPVSEP
jgi:hypothetical protein